MPAATGEATIASTPRWAERTQRSRFFTGRRIGGDDMDIDAELLGMEAARLLDAVHPVDRVEGRQRVEDHAPVRPIADQPLASRSSISSSEMRRPPIPTSTSTMSLIMPAGGKADEHLVDLGAGDPLGLLDRLADRDLALLHVGDEAALHAAALALAGAENPQLPVRAGLGDHRADLGRADVERRDQGSGLGLDGATRH